jgi:hypothetical protein
VESVFSDLGGFTSNRGRWPTLTEVKHRHISRSATFPKRLTD